PGRTMADAKDIDGVLDTLEALTAKKWVKQVDPKDSLKEYGLHAPAITATVTPKKKEGDKTEPTPLVFKFGSKTTYDKDKNAVFAMQTGGEVNNLVFLAPAELFKTLEDVELRDRTVLKFDVAKAKELKVMLVGKVETRELVFELKDKAWVVK